MPISARAAALGFLSTAGAPMRSAALARRAAILGIDAAAMRVALGRLTRDGLVEQPERGAYRIGHAAAALDRVARGWRDAEARVRDWDARWLVVAVDHLGRSDRAQRRRRERALRLGGFAHARGGWWVRADNLAEPLADTAARLHALGLDETAMLLGGALTLANEDAGFRALWPRAAIEEGYRHWIAKIDASTTRLATLDPDAAARETLLLGQAVIRAINTDPLLPDALVDTALRRATVAAMRRYDAVGRRIWAAID